ncbi:MAG: flagellar export chaperone FliS [Oxalicibacterium faecigallinarum]|uniref:Flagellar protein FliS n=1 Tax=Oxalicibacterium faecigallinarum TaxID=573741 RepID=A0A8J3F0J4_9BURK|nr:flagellar export chaperone FliS [Oxalicibacterium faecigallinarum]MDQ7969949.1 flagellar export chaperone FliS [Oxalicibacterium faecigallinarum]GGI16372.1 flagellar protein FliS [Oxalicibacterium faecigallinarum]
MFGTMKSGANAYAKIGMETGVIAANPHKLIVMLFEGAQVALNNALQHMQAGNIPEKGKAITKAIMIIDNGLRASLDKSVGGQIATNLDALYEYMSNRLLVANLNNQAETIQEVLALLNDIKSAWDEIAPQPDAQTPVPAAPQHSAASSYDALAPHMPRLMKA